MTTPARYWRVWFRSTNSSYQYEQFTLGFASLRFFSAADVELSSGLTAGQISLTTGNHFNSTAYPLTNLVDGDNTTAWVANYPYGAATNYINTWYAVTFDFGAGNDVLPSYILARTLSTNFGGTTLSGAIFDFAIDSSPDNITYYRQSMLYRPILANDVDYRIPAVVTNTLYPFPPVANIGGSGGIYGIVSEDGVALPNRPVILFERDTFFKVGWTTTDVNGGYAFNGLNTAREFTVMSYDPSGPPYKNALIWDRITPINTLGNSTSQSAFWARRTRDPSLGGLVSARDYIDGTTYNFMAGNIVGNTERRWGYPDGMNYSPTNAVGGSLKFLRSNRVVGNTGEGVQLYPGLGTFSGVNSAGLTTNYANLTFECIIETPSPGDPGGMHIVWTGHRDSDDTQMYNADPFVYGGTAIGCGPTIEITPTGVLNVRFPLGGRNRSTVRCTANLTPNTVYHIMVTYAQDSEIKLYVNGSLVQTTAISGAGRLWGWVQAYYNTYPYDTANWDAIYNTAQGNAAIRRFAAVTFMGPGSTNNNSGTLRPNGPGYGGAWALAALYNRTFTAGEVSSFYDSFANWDTHIVLPTQSGYMGEVEADNPNFYTRMNDLGAPNRALSLFGQKDYIATYEGTPGYNAAGFVSGSTSVTVSSGSLWLSRVDINSIFTVECFVRPTSVAGTQRIWLSRIFNSNAPVYLSMLSGVLRLNVTDITGTDTLFQFSQTLAINTAYHIAVTYDPWYDKQCKLYINGAMVQTLPAATIPITGADYLMVGSNVSGSSNTISERFQGQIGEFATYNHVLSAARIQAHYDARNS